MSESAAGAWEPRRLEVGTRVQVVLSPECPCYPLRRSFHGQRPVGTVTAVEAYFRHGLEGIWRDIPGLNESHSYEVEFDVPLLTRDGGEIDGGLFAGAELAPPDEAPS